MTFSFGWKNIEYTKELELFYQILVSSVPKAWKMFRLDQIQGQIRRQNQFLTGNLHEIKQWGKILGQTSNYSVLIWNPEKSKYAWWQ
jgi:hypothetical protein